jgi:hypothetical protein
VRAARLQRSFESELERNGEITCLVCRFCPPKGNWNNHETLVRIVDKPAKIRIWRFPEFSLLPIQWVRRALSPGLKRGRGVILTTHPLLVPRLRKSRSYTSSHPNEPLWSVTGPLCLLPFTASKTGILSGNHSLPSEVIKVSVTDTFV